MQVRLMNLRKNASRAYNIHKGKVRALAVLDSSALGSSTTPQSA